MKNPPTIEDIVAHKADDTSAKKDLAFISKLEAYLLNLSIKLGWIIIAIQAMVVGLAVFNILLIGQGYSAAIIVSIILVLLIIFGAGIAHLIGNVERDLNYLESIRQDINKEKHEQN